MLSWIGRFFSSSIGKKVAMAITGLALIGFLVAHLAGNLTLYADDTGEAFNDYAHLLESNPLLPIAEVGLLVLLVVHIVLALKVSAENREARKSRYQIRSDMGARTAGSGSMIVTGLIVGLFLVIHIVDFRAPKLLGDESVEDLALAVKSRLGAPLGAGIYLVGVVALGVHLSHGFHSAFQTLGMNHPKYTPIIAKIGLGLAILIGLGFASFPIVLMLTGGGAE